MPPLSPFLFPPPPSFPFPPQITYSATVLRARAGKPVNPTDPEEVAEAAASAAATISLATNNSAGGAAAELRGRVTEEAHRQFERILT